MKSLDRVKMSTDRSHQRRQLVRLIMQALREMAAWRALELRAIEMNGPPTPAVTPRTIALELRRIGEVLRELRLLAWTLLQTAFPEEVV